LNAFRHFELYKFQPKWLNLPRVKSGQQASSCEAKYASDEMTSLHGLIAGVLNTVG